MSRKFVYFFEQMITSNPLAGKATMCLSQLKVLGLIYEWQKK